jgi:hypothetical protein
VASLVSINSLFFDSLNRSSFQTGCRRKIFPQFVDYLVRGSCGSEGFGEANYAGDGDIAGTCFDVADIGTVKASLLGKAPCVRSISSRRIRTLRPKATATGFFLRV